MGLNLNGVEQDSPRRARKRPPDEAEQNAETRDAMRLLEDFTSPTSWRPSTATVSDPSVSTREGADAFRGPSLDSVLGHAAPVGAQARAVALLVALDHSHALLVGRVGVELLEERVELPVAARVGVLVGAGLPRGVGVGVGFDDGVPIGLLRRRGRVRGLSLAVGRICASFSASRDEDHDMSGLTHHGTRTLSFLAFDLPPSDPWRPLRQLDPV